MNRRLSLALSLVIASTLPAASHAQWAADGVALSTGVGNQTGPRAISDGAGGAYVTWSDTRSGTFDVYAQRVNAGGVVQWTANGEAVRAGTLDQSDPRIVSDGAGGAIIVWVDRRNNGDTDIYAQRIDGTGTAQWAVNGVEMCGAQNDQFNPNVVSDGAGGAIVTWEDARGGSNMVADVYAQRIDANGVVQWLGDGVAISTAANAQSFPTIASDDAGGAVITWQDYRTGSDIYAQRVNAAGAVQWTADGLAICTAANDQSAPAVSSDGAGGAFITWSDARDGFADIYAQRINSGGAIQWTGDGTPVCAASNGQLAPEIVADGAGGAIVTWIDQRNTGTTDDDVFAQRVNASGAAQWTADGVALCTETGGNVQARIIPDDAGGAVVTWADLRAGGLNYDIYAQRINAGGAVQWTGGGVALCTAANGQLDPAIVPDGFGGAMVAWQDLRSNTTFDIYADRVTPGGAIPTAVGRTPAAPSMLAGNGYPNPSSAGTAIDLNLREEADVRVEIFDAAGRRVRAIEMGRVPAGAAQVAFDGRDTHARALPSGVYFCRIRAGTETATRKIVIQR